MHLHCSTQNLAHCENLVTVHWYNYYVKISSPNFVFKDGTLITTSPFSFGTSDTFCSISLPFNKCCKFMRQLENVMIVVKMNLIWNCFLPFVTKNDKNST